jgi:hypothetical protein
MDGKSYLEDAVKLSDGYTPFVKNCKAGGKDSFARIIHCRAVPLLTSMSYLSAKYSEASVGPNPLCKSDDSIRIASSSTVFEIR